MTQTPTPMPANDNRPERLMKLKEVMQMTSLGSSTIYRRLAARTFPQPLQLSEACVRWRETDIVRWIDSFAAAA